MQRQCRITDESFEVSNQELEFLKRVSPSFAGQNFQVPPPTVAPEERQRTRLAFRNLRNLYKRTCDLSGKAILSMYDPKLPGTVYETSLYWSDRWDALQYGVEFDFNRPFFEQFASLLVHVPRIHHYVILSENCDYINGAANCRNCYLSFNMDYCEDCYYLHNSTHTRSSLDSSGVSQCELCYECVDCDTCYELLYSQHCSGCSESYFLSSCQRCNNCIGCSNLVGKQYYIFNKSTTKEEFQALRSELRSSLKRDEFWAKSDEQQLLFPKKYYYGHSNESFSGNGLRHVRNAYDCYDSYELENCWHCNYVFQAKNCMDYNIFGDHSEWIYQCLATGINCSSDLFCVGIWNGSSNNIYCMTLSASSNCFGCCGLTHKQYCILNKQYSAQAYEALVAKIIEHMQRTREWGEFFPPALSPFPFNQTIGWEEYPLNREEALRRGYNWQDFDQKEGGVNEIPLPDAIDDVLDSVVSQTLYCEDTSLPYKIIPQELKLYRTLGIPLPRISPQARHMRRMRRRLPRKLWRRVCEKCHRQLESPYSPQYVGKIYCDNCYAADVF